MLDTNLLLKKFAEKKSRLTNGVSSSYDFSQIANALQNAQFQEQLKNLAAKLEFGNWQGNFGRHFVASQREKNYSVLAIDGSQIFAENHANLRNVALLQVGGVLFTYGASSSSTQYFYEQELSLAQDYDLPTWHASHIDQLRTALELRMAMEWGKAHSADIILLDGSLTYLLDTHEKHDNVIGKNLHQTLQQLLTANLPLFFYVSSPKSQHCTELLRHNFCRGAYFDKPSCLGQCNETTCQLLAMSNDSFLWQNLLPNDGYSQTFNKNYGKQVVSQIFLRAHNPLATHHNSEIAQLQTIGADFTSSNILQILNQVHKGFGYPVSLIHAHHRAVISQGEQDLFFALLTRNLGNEALKLSQKAQFKRTMLI